MTTHYCCLVGVGILNEEEQIELQQQTATLSQFWLHMSDVIQATASGSMLRDMALLELPVTMVTVPDGENERVSNFMFNSHSLCYCLTRWAIGVLIVCKLEE